MYISFLAQNDLQLGDQVPLHKADYTTSHTSK